MAECMAKVEYGRGEAQVKARYFEHDIRRLRPPAGYALNFSVMHDVGTFFVEANDGAWAIENL
ncbi:MAG: hypothetical protein Q8O19_03950 [Rectinemataceae bacterium]|nr:hypothetical protein [Rectinemataceae bacterium]